MARARYFDTPQFADPADNDSLHKVNNVQVTVYENGTNNILTDTLYVANSGVDTLTNPFTISNGEVLFYLETEKRVRIKFDATASGYGTVTRDDENVWPEPSLLRTSIKSTPNGTYEATLTEEPQFRAPGLLRFLGYIYVEDHGIVSGGLQAHAANNTSIMNTLVQTYLNKNFLFGPSSYSFNPGTNFNTEAGFNTHVGLVGVKNQTGFILWGTAGPWLTFAGNANSPIYSGGMKDIMIFHAETPESGATIRNGLLTGPVEFENVRIRSSDPNGSKAAFVGYQIGGIAGLNGTCSILGGTVDLRNDNSVLLAAGKIPIGVLVVNDVFTTALHIDGASIGGGKPDGDLAERQSIAVQFKNTGELDTIRFKNSSFKDNSIAIHFSGLQTAPITNLYFEHMILDVCDQYCILIEPGTGGSVSNLLISSSPWLSAEVTNILASNANGGTISDLSLTGGKLFNAKTAAISLGNGVNGVIINGVYATTALTAGNYAFDFGHWAPSSGNNLKYLNVQGCVANIQGTAGAHSCRVGTNVPTFDIRGNTWKGSTTEAVYAGALDSARKLDNSWSNS